MEASVLRIEQFKDIALADPFFESVKADYPPFATWFGKKANETAYTFRTAGGALDGFLYLKWEDGEVSDVKPSLPAARRLKIGTFKVNPHGTRLGERLMKRAFDTAVEGKAQAIYVTVFEKHEALVQLFLRYGFVKVGTKTAAGGVDEAVLERRLDKFVGDVVTDYPRIPFQVDRHFALGIWPVYHSRLLPDSLLKTENTSILKDVSHTNSIHKIYLTKMTGVEQLKRGDTLMIYRTADGGAAYHTAVITSLCVVEDVRNISTFKSEDDFVAHCTSYSIFTPTELRDFYKTKKYPWLIQFTYNIALSKRPNRAALIDAGVIADGAYSGFFSLTTDQLRDILKLSGDYEKARSLVYSS